MMQPNRRYQAGASFGVTACPRTVVDGCNVYVCPAPPDGGAPVPGSMPAAGTLRITAGMQTIMLAPQPDGSYVRATGAMMLWQGGESISFSAMGQAVPAFAGAVIAPSALTLMTPTLPAAGTHLVVSRSTPLGLSWSGQSAGNVRAELQTADGLTTIYCSFPASAGTGTVSTRVLGNLPIGDGNLFVRALDSVTVSPPGWSISLAALRMLARPEGGPSNATITVQ
jgi:hypothetical protein